MCTIYRPEESSPHWHCIEQFLGEEEQETLSEFVEKFSQTNVLFASSFPARTIGRGVKVEALDKVFYLSLVGPLLYCEWNKNRLGTFTSNSVLVVNSHSLSLFRLL